jgi:putative tryptophan/tyrosine transport system substrate-binding protein
VTTRRRFLIALGAGVLAVPRGSLAQAPSKVARIGFLSFASRQSSLANGRYNAFVQGMRELGYVEGTNFIIEARFADGKIEPLPALAAELVRLKVDVIVASGTPVLRALQHATTTIPVVSTVTADPVGDGFAGSLARPGGNITGLSIGAADLGPKLLELLKAAVPKLTRVAVLLHPENPAHPPRLKRIMSAAQKVGIQLVLAEAGTVQEIEREFAMMTKERANAAIVFPDSFFIQEARPIAAQALKHRLPSISNNQGYAEAGGLMSYGPNLVDNFRRAATYVDKILKGTKPGDLPFEHPTRYSLVINHKTATALGLTIPPALLRQADDLIGVRS